MSNSKKNRSPIIKKGVMDAVNSGNKRRTLRDFDGNDKKMTAEEVAAVFEEDEIAMLKKEYECLQQTPREIEQKINEEVIGQEAVVAKIVYVAYYNQMANFIEDCGYNPRKHINMLLIGPTGCGKTSAIRSLKKHFKVPLAMYSSDSITSAGYIGNKVEDILIRLFEESNRDLPLAERGIIYIDEIDKKVEQISSAGKDVNGKAVQEELLKVLEPNVVDLTLSDRTKIRFDTSRLTVFLGGAFVGLEKFRDKRLRKKDLGFKTNEVVLSTAEIQSSEYIAQDIIDFGFIPEFVGRTLMIGQLRKLNEKDMLKIIREGRESPFLEKVSFLTDFLNVDVQVSNKFLQKIAEELSESETGARSLESRINNFFYPIIQHTLEHNGEYGICIVDDDGDYELVYEDVVYYG